jgi:cell division transport system permease protein
MADGARSGGRRPLAAALGLWLEWHAQTLLASLGRLVRAPAGTLLTMGVIGIALALPTALGLVVDNARVASGGWQDALDLSIYLKTDVPEATGRQLAEHLATRPDLATVRFVGPAEGLAEFRRWSGLGTALDALRDNPLPGLLVVRPRAVMTGLDAVAVERLAAELRALPGVDQVQLDTEWVRRFTAILEALRRAALLIAGLLALAVLMIVGNTIRLDIDARRAEIEVVKLVGGSDGFVRRPFLYGGFWYGLGGALLGSVLVGALVIAFRAPVAQVASAYGSAFALRGLDVHATLALWAAGAGLGWTGAFLAATRHLRRIEPGNDG